MRRLVVAAAALALLLTSCGSTDATSPPVASASASTAASRTPDAPCSPPPHAPGNGSQATPVEGTGPSGLPPPPGPGSLSGRVTDGGCGTPVSGVLVYLYSGASSFVVGTTKTGADGSYRFASIASGSYRVGFLDPLGVYVPSFSPDGADLGSAKPRSIEQAEVLVDGQLYTPDNVPAPPYSASSAHPARHIDVVGDSLVQQSTSVIRQKLDPVGASSVRGISNQRIDQLLPVAERMAANDPQDVVLAMGNNDIRQHLAIDESIANLQTMIERFADARCITVLNLNTHTLDLAFNDEAVQFNQRLVDQLDGQSKVHLVDWDAVVALLLEQGESEQTWFTDGLHLTEAGAGAYASTMHDAIERCGS
jgi:lysophospholipase L1-like esterase